MLMVSPLVTYILVSLYYNARMYEPKVPIAVIDAEVRGVEMFFLTVFSDNTVEYVHYRTLKALSPFLYYSYYSIYK